MLLQWLTGVLLISILARFVTGIEFREGSLLLSPKCHMPARRGMTFNISVGLAGLRNQQSEVSSGQTYALFIGDTVVIGEVSEGVFILDSSEGGGE